LPLHAPQAGGPEEPFAGAAVACGDVAADASGWRFELRGGGRDLVRGRPFCQDGASALHPLPCASHRGAGTDEEGRGRMFVSKIHLSRRTVLEALGVAIGLPLLDAMIPAATALAQTAAAARPIMTFVYFPHGAVMDQWTPTSAGADFELPPILAPLAAFQKQLTVVSGCENKAAGGNAAHANTPGTWLSCLAPRSGHEPYGGVSIDQVAASRIGNDMPLKSLQVGTEEHGGPGSWDRNYWSGCGKTISFSTPTTPLRMESDPRSLFQLLVGRSPGAVEASVLDQVGQPAADLSRRLGRRDRVVMDDYLSGVREIERRVQDFRAVGFREG